MSGYQNFAFYYDALTQNISYKDRADYFDMLIKKHDINKKDTNILLDLACGTGSLSEEMSRLGYDVIGIDSSDSMLNIALDKKYDSGLNIQYLCQDMTKLDMFGTIDVTICALDSINHLPNFNAVKKAVEKVSLFCEPNGLFILDMNTIYKHKNVLGNNTFIYETDDIYCIWQNTYFSDDNSVQINLDFFEKQDDNSYKRYEESFSELAYEIDDMDNLFINCGFEILAKYDYDTTNEYKNGDEKIIYVLCKK